MTVWLTPRDWTEDDTITAQRLNDISQNLTYLEERPRDIYHNVYIPGDWTTTSTTPVVALSGLSLSLVTNGGDLLVGMSLNAKMTAAAAIGYFDFRLDGTVYWRQGAPSGGFWLQSDYYQTVNWIVPWTGIGAGAHTLEIMAWVASSTLTIATASEVVNFWALET
ncbi:hypothetical protein LCGC14_0939070 [marine sediment metagenome]|uniref:Uncharacterized protein n=1 Tax=marine sediment metagenome TaxID=412755 RepID=A0A0F9NQA9_9ZZZZ